MRVCFVSPRYATDIAGGAELHLRQFAEHLDAAGHDVSVLTTCARSIFTWANEFPAGPDSVNGIRVERHRVSASADPLARERLQRCVDAGLQPTPAMEDAWLREMGHSASLLDAVAAAAERVDVLFFAPYLVSSTVFGAAIRPERSVIMPCFHDEPYARFRAVRRTLCGVAGLTPSTQPERDLIDRILGPAAPPMRLVGAGFDAPRELDPEGFRRRHRLSGDLITYAGRKDGSKNFPLLAEFATLYNRVLSHRGPVTLVAMGGGDHALPAAARAVIRDLGFVSEKEKFEAMAASVAVVNLSVMESLSYVVMEAWSCGTPVIVHASGAVTRHHCEVSGGGLWVRSAEEFAIALDRLRSEPKLAHDLGAAGRTHVAGHHSWPAALARLEAALREFVPIPAAA